MTVNNTSNKVRIVGDGVLTSFGFDFKVFSSEDLKVYTVVRATSVSTLKTITTDYTVSINSVTEGGTVTFLTAPLSTEDVLIVREVDVTQPTSIPDVGSVTKAQLENALDRLTMISQQIKEILDRALTTDIADPTIPQIIPPLVTGGYLTNNGTDLEWDPLVVAAGAVPGAANPGDDNKFLRANGGAWAWQLMQMAEINDMSAFGRTWGALADAAAARTNLSLTYPGMLRKFRSGLNLSRNTTTPTTKLDIASGVAMDTTDTAPMDLSSTLVKQLNASWAVGDDTGALDGTETVPGTMDASTWYYVWLIQRSDTGVVDVLVSESSTTPTLPTNYDRKRRIGCIYSNSSNEIEAFRTEGNVYWHSLPVLDFSTAGPGVGASAQSVKTPAIKSTAILQVAIRDARASPTGDARLLISSLDDQDIVPGVLEHTLSCNTTTTLESNATTLWVTTNGSSQVRVRYGGTVDGNISIYSKTLGFIDPFED